MSLLFLFFFFWDLSNLGLLLEMSIIMFDLDSGLGIYGFKMSFEFMERVENKFLDEKDELLFLDVTHN